MARHEGPLRLTIAAWGIGLVLMLGLGTSRWWTYFEAAEFWDEKVVERLGPPFPKYVATNDREAASYRRYARTSRELQKREIARTLGWGVVWTGIVWGLYFFNRFIIGWMMKSFDRDAE